MTRKHIVAILLCALYACGGGEPEEDKSTTQPVSCAASGVCE